MRGVLFISDGFRAKNTQLGAVGVPFVRGGDIGDGWVDTRVADHVLPEFSGQIAVKLTQPGDVAFITKGTVGRTGRIRLGQPPVVFAPQVCYWRSLDLNELDSTYLFYLLRSRWFQAQLNGVKTSGSMVADYVSISDQQHFTLPVPPIETQRRIGAILGALDDKIELNRRMNRTLEELAQALFKSWFIDFDGHDDFVDSEIGPVPRGWTVGTVADLGAVVTGKTPPTDKHSNYGDEYPFIKIPDMHGHVWASRTASQLSATGHSSQATKLLPPHSVCVSCIATPGLAVLTRRPSHTNQQINSVVLDDRDTSYWAYHALKGLGQLIIARASGGSVTKNLNKGQFERLPVVLPPVAQRRRFQRVAGPLLERIAVGGDESYTLTDLRDTLLPKLISGELRVPEAEGLVEAAV
jgi:type I restriction enzyme S subunit